MSSSFEVDLEPINFGIVDLRRHAPPIDFSKAKLNICKDHENKKCFKDNLCSMCCLEQTKSGGSNE